MHDEKLMTLFLTESKDLIGELERGLLALETEPSARSEVDPIFRAVHTLKGNASLVGFNQLVDIAHAMETALEQVRRGDVDVSETLTKKLLRATDMLRLLALGPGEADLAEVEEVQSALNGLLDNVATGDQDEPPPRQSCVWNPDEQSSSIRVGVDKLDRLVDQVGELAFSVAGARACASDCVPAPTEALWDAFDALDHQTQKLRDQVMQVRVVPLSSTFDHLKRLVWDLGQQQRKKVRLEVTGAEIEVDKSVIDGLAAPLMHLVRNAIAHGIESPAERVAAGKAPTGTVRLRSRQSGGTVVIEVADDGKGIDIGKVMATAEKRGIIAGTSHRKSAISLLFLPGFSTCDAVTASSGRGFGLDVVRRRIDEMGGRIEVRTAPGDGTFFRITLPLTMSIVDGMAAKVGSEVMVIPTRSVLHQFRPSPGDLKSLEGRGETLALHDEVFPLVRLDQVFGLQRRALNPSSPIALVGRSDQGLFCLLVDDVLGSLQAVVRSLDCNFRQVEGVAGATVLGNGRTALIVDIPGVARLAFGAQDRTSLWI